jgi:hypothetical protein
MKQLHETTRKLLAIALRGVGRGLRGRDDEAM